MKRRLGWWLLGGVVLLVGAGIALHVFTGKPEATEGHAENASPVGGGKGGRGGPGGPVPVSMQEVSQEDVPIYLQGIGNVQASQNVTLRSRVDGQLQKVLFTEGQEVEANAVIAVIDPRPYQAALEQAEAKRAQDQAQLVVARKDLERYRTLVEEKLQQAQTLDQQQALVSQLEAAVRGDAAAVDNARVNLSYTRITAPFAGRVGLRLVDLGNLVHASDTGGLVTLAQLTPISVIFTLPEQNVGLINAQQQAQGTLQVDALSPDGKTVLDHGKLLVVDNQIDATTGTVKLKASFPNAERKLWPGQFVNARLLLKVRESATVVPAPAIQRGPDGTFVYVLDNGTTAQVRPVKVAQIQSGKALIDDGLQVGEKVVTDGQYRLQPGAKVSIQAAGGSGAAGNAPTKARTNASAEHR